MYSKTFKTALIAIAFFLAFQNSTHAQFLNKDAVWNVSAIWPESWGRTYSFKIIKDTVINDTIYSTFKVRDDWYALREDSDKVFFRLIEPNSNYAKFGYEEHLAYDFGLENNDSIGIRIPICYDVDTLFIKVIKIDSILVGKEYKKRISLVSLNHDSFPFDWIEGVGSNNGPLYFATGISEGEFSIGLNCYGINGVHLYPMNCYNCSPCIYLKAGLISNTVKNPILFNNALNQIKVGLPTEETCILSVYSVTGAKIIYREIACNRLVTVEPLKPGVYIFNVKTGKTKFSKKIVIQ